ncbi:unnamed protein product [Allacma fusca]|uniref:Uncharacterized protein n=1 Tax=Allacma fusca TaxID=39272 RepID=A0A8J2PIG0_9HEXA|nr:unnamed protein product [Allacma fusca]
MGKKTMEEIKGSELKHCLKTRDHSDQINRMNAAIHSEIQFQTGLKEWTIKVSRKRNECSLLLCGLSTKAKVLRREKKRLVQ